LANLPGVEEFQCLNQISEKNPFDFCLSMEFQTELLYRHYNDHPEHIRFVKEQWAKCVAGFQEADFSPF
jgi:Stress responsive A/B Barrel Domain